MADNVTLPGTGSGVATREVTYSGDLTNMQVVGLATLSGPDDAKVPTDISDTNPMPVAVLGEVVEAIEALRFAVQSLTRSIGFALPSTQGWPIMEVRQPTAANLNVTLASTTISSGTVTTVSTLTNQSQQGGFATNDYVPTIMRMGADNLRRNIVVT